MTSCKDNGYNKNCGRTRCIVGLSPNDQLTPWLSGRTPACHVGDPGSILGQGIFQFLIFPHSNYYLITLYVNTVFKTILQCQIDIRKSKIVKMAIF